MGHGHRRGETRGRRIQVPLLRCEAACGDHGRELQRRSRTAAGLTAMPRHDLLFAWAAIAVAAPVAGLVAGPRLRRSLPRGAVVILSSAAGAIVCAAFTPISFSGVLADHVALMAAYSWAWTLVGMLRSRVSRVVIVGVPTLATAWILARPAATFFLVIVLADLTSLPERTMSVGCGWTTRTARVQPYGWVGNSGYDLGV